MTPKTKIPYILVAPLDWGLGHATRCVPIIRLLEKQGHKVLVATSGRSASFLKQEFPDLLHLELPSYSICYPKQEGVLFALSFLIQLPLILWTIWRENRILSKWVSEKNIQYVISDNRYGLFHPKVPTAFVTHQLFIKTPFAQNVLEKTIGFFWKRYQEIWVPDFAGDINLSGTLSHRNPLPKTLESKVHYLGPLSRMDSGKKSKEVSKVNKIKVLAIISGPEPQRTLLEEKTLEQLKQCDGNHVVVGGRPESTQQKMVLKTQQNGTLTHYPHLPQQELESLIAQSEVVFCRSGYTTIMELYALQQKGVVFVPTPGQTEQEYLCEHFQSRKVGPYHSQKELNIPALLKEQAEGQYCGFSELQDKNRNSTQEQSTSLESFLANHPLLNTIAADVSGKKNTTS